MTNKAVTQQGLAGSVFVGEQTLAAEHLRNIPDEYNHRISEIVVGTAREIALAIKRGAPTFEVVVVSTPFGLNVVTTPRLSTVEEIENVVSDVRRDFSSHLTDELQKTLEDGLNLFRAGQYNAADEQFTAVYNALDSNEQIAINT